MAKKNRRQKRKRAEQDIGRSVYQGGLRIAWAGQNTTGDADYQGQLDRAGAQPMSRAKSILVCWPATLGVDYLVNLFR